MNDPSLGLGLERYYGPRRDLCLCLSGGGFRAAAFHLGVVRWLYLAGVLRHVEEVRAVSGGAIVAAWLSRHGPRLLDPPDAHFFDAQVRDPLLSFLRRDIRTKPILLTLGVNSCYKAPRVRLLSAYIDELLQGAPEHSAAGQRFRLVAFDIVKEELVEMDAAGPNAALQVVASAAYPPVFGPVRLGDARLIDGGIASNLGLSGATLHEWTAVMISDAGRAAPSWTKARLIPLSLRLLPILRDGSNRAFRHHMSWANSDSNVVSVAALAHASWYGADDDQGRRALRSRLRASKMKTDLAGFAPGDLMSLLELGAQAATESFGRSIEVWSARVADGDGAVTPRGRELRAFLDGVDFAEGAIGEG